MIIKINYNYVAAFLSLVVVVTFLLVELLSPSNVTADVTVNSEDEHIKLPVAMYHHILDSPSRLGDYVISPAQFEEDLKYIQKKGYTTITSVELLNFIENDGELPEKPILITFDDGYESVHEYAFPLLQKYNMKAIVSIIGKHTDIFSNKDEPRHINYSHLSWDQLREMQQSGVFEIQNHSYDMHQTQSSPRYGIRMKKGESDEDYKTALLNDIGGLSDQITNEIGVTPTVFAYPFGALNKQSRPILEELGFKIILTCEEKVNSISPDDELPLKLKRYNRASKYSTYDYYSKLLK
ncbi:MAG: polysaccharide deacetylase family protein [Oscillospiraceae bacterium]